MKSLILLLELMELMEISFPNKKMRKIDVSVQHFSKPMSNTDKKATPNHMYAKLPSMFPRDYLSNLYMFSFFFTADHTLSGPPLTHVVLSGPTHVALSGPPLTHVVFSGPPLTSVLRTFIFVWDVAVMVQNHAAVIHSHRSHGRDWAYSHVMAACKEVGIRP